MLFEDVRTFLAAVDAGSIARGADTLFIGQATASQRIRHLESDLGIELLYRHAGVRRVSLTPEGEEFLSIARQWMSLEHRAEGIKDLGTRQELRFATTNMFHHYYFKDFYKSYLLDNPQVSLYMQNEHATEIYQLIEQQQIDLGIVGNQHISSSVTTRLFFEEPMAVLCHADCTFAQTQNLIDLDPALEIYAHWSAQFELWHHDIFPHATHRVTSGDVDITESLIDLPGCWAILTDFLARKIARGREDLCIVPIPTEVLPARKVYILYDARGKSWMRDVTVDFLKSMRDTLIKEGGAFTFNKRYS